MQKDFYIKKMFNNDENPENTFFDAYKIINSKQPKKTFKDICIGHSNDYMEDYNKRSDQEYSKKHPNTKDDIFDKMNNYMTKGLYLSDQYFGSALGHGIATAGRVARNNYEQYYQKSPFTDPYEKGWDAFQKATNIDY